MAKPTANRKTGTDGRRFNRYGGGAADWSKVDAENIRSAIVSAANAGGALRFGYSSDGGAFALGIYGDGDKPYTEFIRPSENMEGVLTELEALFNDIVFERDNKPAKTS